MLKSNKEIISLSGNEEALVSNIIKEIRDVISNIDSEKEEKNLSKKEKENMIIKIEKEMQEAAKNLDFERATELRDILFELKEKK